MKKIYVVGIGPGDSENMTLRAVNALKESDVITGYDYYIDLIKPFTEGKEVYSSTMTKELDRCQKALEFALEDKTVAMVSGGDAGVYGMACIVNEVCRDYPQVQIEVIPGITACCSGGAVLGAPLSHDFAVVSLSDRLTPWDKIEKRLTFASQADFVICIYNPRSKTRTEHLKKACEIMLSHKDGNTPCGYVKNIGRQGEQYGILTLDELKGFEADMFTTVFVGNSQTEVINGRLVTPRGYAGI